MHQYGSTAQRKRMYDIFLEDPSGSWSDVLFRKRWRPLIDLFRYLDLTSPNEVIFTRVIDVRLASGVIGRYWFALWKQTGHCLALVQADEAGGRMHPDKTRDKCHLFAVPEEIWLRERPKLQSAVGEWLNSRLEFWLRSRSELSNDDKKWLDSKEAEYNDFFVSGYQRSTNQFSTPTDHVYLDKFIQLFTEVMVKRKSERPDPEFWSKTLQWVDRYNTVRTSMFYPRRISVFNPMKTSMFVPHFWTKFCPPTTVRLIDLPELAEFYPHLDIPE